MKPRFLYGLLLSLALLAGCGKDNVKPDPTPTPEPGPSPMERTGESGITYQVLVYSFADSDGDGCGDLNGVKSKLDYLYDMGVTALWLSPIHKASSYHGYDVLDYESVNPDYGTEADLKSLIEAAHAKGIKIYLDYVLNHSSKDHPWFLDAKKGLDSPYRDYFIFSDNPGEDIRDGKIPMIATEGVGGYDSGQWFPAVSGSSESARVRFTLGLDNARKPKTLTVERVDEVENPGPANTGIYLYYGDGKMEQFHASEGNTCSLTLDISSSWGVLVRTSTTSWDNGTKYGAPKGKNQLEWGKSLALSNSDAQDILLPGMVSTMYHSHFWTSYMADFNYGPVETCENSGAFNALCSAADKWIRMGVDGFRLDAVKHIYHNANSDENPTFLKKFYDHCSATFKSAGGKGDFYMVGEQFSVANEAAPYYKGIPALFEFSFWWTLKDAINKGVGGNFVSDIQGFRSLYANYRPDFIEATKLSNHDEDRAGSDLGRNTAKMKLAAAVLLTACGEPYVYQGEELGYWGTKSNGDEGVRTPILWQANGGSLADAKLSGKVDRSMLTPAMSVESQLEDKFSILNVYRTFGQARDSYVSLAKGSFDYCVSASSNPAVAAWYRTFDDQSVLVAHNFSGGDVTLNLSGEKLSEMIASNGNVSVKDSRLSLGAYSSVIFLR